MTDATYGPRSKANATLLVQTARDLGYPTSVVKTTRGGYKVPQDLLDAALGIQNIEEGVTYPAPPENVSQEPSAASDEGDKPRGNASREAWAEYAQAHGVEVTDDLSRDDIKDLVNEEE